MTLTDSFYTRHQRAPPAPASPRGDGNGGDDDGDGDDAGGGDNDDGGDDDDPPRIWFSADDPGRTRPASVDAAPPPDWSTVVRPGEALVFRGDLWHQTYCHGPGITVAATGQFCDRAALRGVLDHMREWADDDQRPREL